MQLDSYVALVRKSWIVILACCPGRRCRAGRWRYRQLQR
jgi:hypothetical protein